MPRGDGTGPAGKGQGRGQGKGQGQGRGKGQGRMGGPLAGGAVGFCICPNCGHRESHKLGEPCTQKLCPNCSTAMTKE